MARQEYGVTPWGRWFVDILDSYRMGERINRGRSYANTGKVLDFAAVGQTVTAKVKGSYAPYYRVSVRFPELPDGDKAKLGDLVKDNPALLAELASGVLSDEFLSALKKEHIGLIPARWRDMKRSCSCPDDGDPCKHMAAVYFVLARAIDSDPHILFKLRGVDLSGIASSYNAAFSAEVPPPFVLETQDDNEGAASGGVQDGVYAEIPSCLNLIISLLPPRAPFYPQNKDFALLLTRFYHEAARYESWIEYNAGGFDEKRASRSRWLVVADRREAGAELTVTEETADGEKIEWSLYDAFLALGNATAETGAQSFLALSHLCKFIHRIINAGAFVPYPLEKDGSLRVVWTVYNQLSLIAGQKAHLAAEASDLLRFSGANGAKKAASGAAAVNLITSKILTEWTRRLYFARKDISAAERGIAGLFFQNTAIDTRSPAQRSLPLALWRYLSVFSIDFHQYNYRITLKEARGAKSDAVRLKMSMDVVFETEAGVKAVPLHKAAVETGGLDVLKAPTALAAYLAELKTLMRSASVMLEEERLVLFLDEAAPLLAKLGIEAVLPKSLRRLIKPRLVLRAEAKSSGRSLNSYLDLPSLLDWDRQVAVDGEVVSEAEFEALLRQKRGVVRFRDKYVRIDSEELARLFASAKAGAAVSAGDFLKHYFAGDAALSVDAQQIIDKLLKERTDGPPPGLNAALRPYQLTGFRWALSLLTAGFGCILADDMGLGKTVQAIAVMLQLREEGLLGRQCLIVCPAALIENWQRELERFAPPVRAARYHGKGRRLDGGADCYITTYQTAALDKAKLIERGFSLLIVDEAHLMKNAGTKSSRAVKELRAVFRFALSGTPVENRLEDMRSLFDFILPGYLGGSAEFLREFRKPIEVLRDTAKAALLRKITAPFLLRRVKTDKAVIADLPDKITIHEYSALHKEQAALYENVIALMLEKIERLGEGAQRSGMVFSLLTSLKQICDHPRVYDKESPAQAALSGKAELLVALLDEALAADEKILVFSQYVETLDCLHAIIKKELAENALLYHGGLPQKKRADVVDRFQNDGAARIMLISLRAGGLGLNLTAASRVIHYDLWYNPAVESQATDRAFRIGQKRTVFVHRFITKNSYEEKIDAMLTAKKELAGLTVSSGESWLARLDPAELRGLFERG